MSSVLFRRFLVSGGLRVVRVQVEWWFLSRVCPCCFLVEGFKLICQMTLRLRTMVDVFGFCCFGIGLVYHVVAVCGFVQGHHVDYGLFEYI